MQIEKINQIFCCKEIAPILSHIASKNDFRICLNKDVMEEYRRFFENVILCSFVVDVEGHDLTQIFDDVESYLSRKLSSKLNLADIYRKKDKVAEYFNKILGGSKFYFHGTLSNMENSILGLHDNNYIKIQLCKNIDNIYYKHGIYAAFESGIKDFESNSFWVATSPGSACFYALQSPEYFARFCSRSDYYKQDIFKYDKIAYYRRDFRACKRNIETEIKEFNFSQDERKTILKNFKELWDNVVFKDSKNILLLFEIKNDNTQSFDGTESLIDMLLKYFVKENLCLDLERSKKLIKGKIILPDVKPYLKRQHRLINKKFVIFDDKKYYPDFYVDCKYSEHLYYSFKNNEHFKTIHSNIALNEKSLLIMLTNEARPNTKAAKRFFNTQNLPSVADVVAYYYGEFSCKVRELEKEKDLEAKKRLVKQICEDVGLKYVVSLKYNKYFKNINQYYIKTYRSLLGVKLFEIYDGVSDITENKLDRLLALYKEILTAKQEFFKDDLPLKAFRREVKFIK